MDIPVVKSVTVIRPFTLEVTFKGGEKRIVEMADEIRNRGGVFTPLKDPDYFAQAFVDPVSRTVAWPNGVDLAPEWLYEPDPKKWQKLVEESRALDDKQRSKKPRKEQNARI